MKPIVLSVSILFFLIFGFEEVSGQGKIVNLETGVESSEIEIDSDSSCNCQNRCGDGFCQQRGCGSCGVPCCETQESCPQDCLRDKPTLEDFIAKMKEKLDKVSKKPSKEESSSKLKIFQKGKGLITQCDYGSLEKVCGKCFCLKAIEGSVLVFNKRKLRGCARLNISEVGDLSNFVGKTVYYEGTAEFNSDPLCRRQFQLFKIRAIDNSHSEKAQ